MIEIIRAMAPSLTLPRVAGEGTRGRGRATVSSRRARAPWPCLRPRPVSAPLPALLRLHPNHLPALRAPPACFFLMLQIDVDLPGLQIKLNA